MLISRICYQIISLAQNHEPPCVFWIFLHRCVQHVMYRNGIVHRVQGLTTQLVQGKLVCVGCTELFFTLQAVSIKAFTVRLELRLGFVNADIFVCVCLRLVCVVVFVLDPKKVSSCGWLFINYLKLILFATKRTSRTPLTSSAFTVGFTCVFYVCCVWLRFMVVLHLVQKFSPKSR